MFDLKWIRDHPAKFDAALARRGLSARAEEILNLDRRWRDSRTGLQELQRRRNTASKEIGQAIQSGDSAKAAALKAEVAGLKDRLPQLESEVQGLERAIEAVLESLPNRPLAEVPDGVGEADNRLERQWGKPRSFDFEPRQHFELGAVLGSMDFEAAAKLSGSRFAVLTGGVARLHRALAQFMLDLHTREHGYLEVNSPVLVREEPLYGSGQLPKFAEDLFRTTADYWLIPTAEVTLTNLPAGSILDEAVLPQRYAAHTLCFRSEAGAAGKDTRGMLRQHQFEKVELVSIAHPDRSEEEHRRMTVCAETVLQRLDLTYRVMLLCTGDMGFGARKTYDLEVWLPGQRSYREISSCSNCGEFQALRMKTRMRPAEGRGLRPVHSLNGSGVAVGRALIAVMENYQQADGSITIPEVLRPYLHGEEMLRPHA
ncbi:MAG: serine--tRNA ligase [Rhodospirillales bacterium]|nr:serine--tRNA ligase [Rhodospirillales bacterium]